MLNEGHIPRNNGFYLTNLYWIDEFARSFQRLVTMTINKFSWANEMSTMLECGGSDDLLNVQHAEMYNYKAFVTPNMTQHNL